MCQVSAVRICPSLGNVSRELRVLGRWEERYRLGEALTSFAPVRPFPDQATNVVKAGDLGGEPEKERHWPNVNFSAPRFAGRIVGGVDGTRTRDLRRDRPAF